MTRDGVCARKVVKGKNDPMLWSREGYLPLRQRNENIHSEQHLFAINKMVQCMQEMLPYPSCFFPLVLQSGPDAPTYDGYFVRPFKRTVSRQA